MMVELVLSTSVDEDKTMEELVSLGVVEMLAVLVPAEDPLVASVDELAEDVGMGVSGLCVL